MNPIINPNNIKIWGQRTTRWSIGLRMINIRRRQMVNNSACDGCLVESVCGDLCDRFKENLGK